MKELIAKELLFFFIALIVAIPVSILFLFVMNLQPAGNDLTAEESMLEIEFLIIGALLGFLGVYLARLTVWAVKTIVPKGGL